MLVDSNCEVRLFLAKSLVMTCCYDLVERLPGKGAPAKFVQSVFREEAEGQRRNWDIVRSGVKKDGGLGC